MCSRTLSQALKDALLDKLDSSIFQGHWSLELRNMATFEDLLSEGGKELVAGRLPGLVAASHGNRVPEPDRESQRNLLRNRRQAAEVSSVVLALFLCPE